MGTRAPAAPSAARPSASAAKLSSSAPAFVLAKYLRPPPSSSKHRWMQPPATGVARSIRNDPATSETDVCIAARSSPDGPPIAAGSLSRVGLQQLAGALDRHTHLRGRGAADVGAARDRTLWREQAVDVLFHFGGKAPHRLERQLFQAQARFFGETHCAGDGLVSVAKCEPFPHQVVGKVCR